MLKRIPLEQIVRNEDQPRKVFEPQALEELAASIRANGLMQPITVRPIGHGTYQVVAGERRLRAHRLLAERGQLPDNSILAHVRRMGEVQRDIEAIIENLARAEITPMEEARAFKRMLDHGMTPEELAQKLGMGQVWRIRDRVRLLNLSPTNQKLFESGQISANDAYEISRLEREADQTRVIQMIARGQLTGYKAVRAAVLAIVDNLSQEDIFGAAGEAPRASEEDVATVNRMEDKVNRIADMVSAGFKDGECVIARKVSPDRTRAMADKLRVMRQHLLQMENQLREAAAQAELLAA